jgi:hypothetical protein
LANHLARLATVEVDVRRISNPPTKMKNLWVMTSHLWLGIASIKYKSPAGTIERFFRPIRDFGKLRTTNPSHKWLGYCQGDKTTPSALMNWWGRFPRAGAPRLSGADRQPWADGFESHWDSQTGAPLGAAYL